MKDGLFRLGISQDNDSLLAPIPFASLSDAANIREVTLRYRTEHHCGTHPPFVLYGRTSYSPNYFLAHFLKLERVSLSVEPTTRGMITSLGLSAKEKGFSNGIELVNSRLGTSGKLQSVYALHIDETEVASWSPRMLLQMKACESWFWQAEEGSYLKPPTAALSRPPSHQDTESASKSS